MVSTDINQQEDRLTPPIMQKIFLLNLRNTCADNYIKGADDGFKRSVVSMLAAMSGYYEKDVEFKKDLEDLKKQKAPTNVFFETWVKLQRMLSSDPDIYPTRLVEGVITDDDVQRADSFGKK